MGDSTIPPGGPSASAPYVVLRTRGLSTALAKEVVEEAGEHVAEAAAKRGGTIVLETGAFKVGTASESFLVRYLGSAALGGLAATFLSLLGFFSPLEGCGTKSTMRTGRDDDDARDKSPKKNPEPPAPPKPITLQVQGIPGPNDLNVTRQPMRMRMQGNIAVGDFENPAGLTVRAAGGDDNGDDDSVNSPGTGDTTTPSGDAKDAGTSESVREATIREATVAFDMIHSPELRRVLMRHDISEDLSIQISQSLLAGSPADLSRALTRLLRSGMQGADAVQAIVDLVRARNLWCSDRVPVDVAEPIASFDARTPLTSSQAYRDSLRQRVSARLHDAQLPMISVAWTPDKLPHHFGINSEGGILISRRALVSAIDRPSPMPRPGEAPSQEAESDDAANRPRKAPTLVPPSASGPRSTSHAQLRAARRAFEAAPDALMGALAELAMLQGAEFAMGHGAKRGNMTIAAELLPELVVVGEMLFHSPASSGITTPETQITASLLNHLRHSAMNLVVPKMFEVDPAAIAATIGTLQGNMPTIEPINLANAGATEPQTSEDPAQVDREIVRWALSWIATPVNQREYAVQASTSTAAPTSSGTSTAEFVSTNIGGSELVEEVAELALRRGDPFLNIAHHLSPANLNDSSTRWLSMWRVEPERHLTLFEMDPAAAAASIAAFEGVRESVKASIIWLEDSTQYPSLSTSGDLTIGTTWWSRKSEAERNNALLGAAQALARGRTPIPEEFHNVRRRLEILAHLGNGYAEPFSISREGKIQIDEAQWNATEPSEQIDDDLKTILALESVLSFSRDSHSRMFRLMLRTLQVQPSPGQTPSPAQNELAQQMLEKKVAALRARYVSAQAFPRETAFASLQQTYLERYGEKAPQARHVSELAFSFMSLVRNAAVQQRAPSTWVQDMILSVISPLARVPGSTSEFQEAAKPLLVSAVRGSFPTADWSATSLSREEQLIITEAVDFFRKWLSLPVQEQVRLTDESAP